MKRFRLSKKAHRDLLEIWDYIAADSFDSADRVADELYKAFQALAETPGMGHRRRDLTRRKVLFWTVRSYFVIYKPDSVPMNIVRVLHGRRNIRRILEKR